MLCVRNLNPIFDRDEHLKTMRTQLDKMRKYAQDKFGYRANYMKQHDFSTTDKKIKVMLQTAERNQTLADGRLGTTNAHLNG